MQANTGWWAVPAAVYTGTPVLVEYTLDEYAKSLEQVIVALNAWGTGHRKRLMQSGKAEPVT